MRHDIALVGLELGAASVIRSISLFTFRKLSSAQQNIALVVSERGAASVIPSISLFTFRKLISAQQTLR